MQLTEIITEHGAQEAVERFALNPGAEWTDKAFKDGLERFPNRFQHSRSDHRARARSGSHRRENGIDGIRAAF